MMSEVKPCPFCDSEPMVVRDRRESTDHKIVRVMCEHTGCPIENHPCSFDAWNCRAPAAFMSKIQRYTLSHECNDGTVSVRLKKCVVGSWVNYHELASLMSIELWTQEEIDEANREAKQLKKDLGWEDSTEQEPPDVDEQMERLRERVKRSYREGIGNP